MKDNSWPPMSNPESGSKSLLMLAMTPDPVWSIEAEEATLELLTFVLVFTGFPEERCLSCLYPILLHCHCFLKEQLQRSSQRGDSCIPNSINYFAFLLEWNHCFGIFSYLTGLYESISRWPVCHTIIDTYIPKDNHTGASETLFHFHQ